MRNHSQRLCTVFAAALLALAGCTPSPIRYDPLSVNGRDGGGATPSYPALMRIGTVARSGGDYPTALGVFRRAADLAPGDPTPYVAIGDTLMDMGKVDEAILAYNSALARHAYWPPAERGLARAYLKTGKPELALVPLSRALKHNPPDASLYVLLGVTNDMTGRHQIAQDWYRRGLAVAPGDPALNVDFALSLAITGNYPAAINQLTPLAMAPEATPDERQTLSLLYGLAGNRQEAARIASVDLDAAAVQHNLAYFDALRALSPQARARAILSTTATRAGAS